MVVLRTKGATRRSRSPGRVCAQAGCRSSRSSAWRSFTRSFFAMRPTEKSQRKDRSWGRSEFGEKVCQPLIDGARELPRRGGGGPITRGRREILNAVWRVHGFVIGG